MFAPTSTVAGLVFALLTLACWGSWSTTLVLASKRMAFELYYFDWAISFIMTAIVVGIFVGFLPGDMSNRNFNGDNYFQELFGHKFGTYCFSILGGILWNMANVLLCKGIGLMGQALGFPLCVGLGMISGSITGFVIAGSNNTTMLFVGDSLALVGICFVGLLASRKDAELQKQKQKEPLQFDGKEENNDASMARKFIICLTGGLLLGLNNIGVMNATRGEDAMSAPANQVFFSVGVVVSSLILIPLSVAFPLEGHKATTTLGEIFSKYKDVQAVDHFMAGLGGFTLCCGFFCFNIAGGTNLGPAASYSIGQSAPLVGIAWGTFFFKEFQGTSWSVKGIIPVVVLFFFAAIVCLAQA